VEGNIPATSIHRGKYTSYTVKTSASFKTLTTLLIKTRAF